LPIDELVRVGPADPIIDVDVFVRGSPASLSRERPGLLQLALDALGVGVGAKLVG